MSDLGTPVSGPPAYAFKDAENVVRGDVVVLGVVLIEAGGEVSDPSGPYYLATVFQSIEMVGNSANQTLLLSNGLSYSVDKSASIYTAE